MRISRRIDRGVVVETYDFRNPDTRAQEEFELATRCVICGDEADHQPGGMGCNIGPTEVETDERREREARHADLYGSEPDAFGD